MEAQSMAMALSCDDSYISLLLNPSENLDSRDNTLMSDDKFAEELQLQETIMASLITHQLSRTTISSPTSRNTILRETGESSKAAEAGESSQSTCEICADRKDKDRMFPVQSCTHDFCTECIAKHISIKIAKRSTILAENPLIMECPGSDCGGVIELDACREVVPKDVITMWDDALCESMIPSSQRFYCPYKNCSGLLVNDGGDGGAVIREAECPFCRRLFCANCNVAWHSGLSCEEFSRLGENEREREDIMVHELAKKNKWQRCPRCRFFVEKNEGCLHMTCRCGFQFCYACGGAWTSTHGGCQ